ncbi:MAG TPA: hypothetical protein VMW49_06500 [Candidatus Dormibacteraeota bacterium]|nr:hypothetical protein [Candidatus Dormibacteraeota bacterium]
MSPEPSPRLEIGDWVGIAASAVLLVSFFVPWYGISLGSLAFTVNGFRSWGWLTFAALATVVILVLLDRRPVPGVPRLPRSVGRGTVLLVGGVIEAVGAGLFLITATSGSALGLSIGPRFGVFVALAAAAGSIGAGLLKGRRAADPQSAPPSGDR